MERLPDELVIYVLSLVPPLDVIRVQRVCRRFCSLARDDTLWKVNCFLTSRYETLHRLRLAWETQESRLAELRRAISGSDASFAHLEHETDALLSPLSKDGPRRRALAHWEPAYPSENVDFYQEYIHRNAPVSARYFQPVYDSSSGSRLESECLGVGILRDGLGGHVHRTLAPLDDGSICLWDVVPTSPVRGTVVARSAPGLLQGDAPGAGSMLAPTRFTSETGAADNVSIDHSRQKAYLANQAVLTEIDLVTLKAVRREHFPFPITSLSSATSDTPLTIGTNMTLHLYDIRTSRPQLSLGLMSRCELIAGSPIFQHHSDLIEPPKGHFSLSQPGPLSILHPPMSPASSVSSHSIWVGGRFTSLLHYDRRCWPQIHSTVFSGARISSLSIVPYPFVHPDLRKPASDSSLLRKTKLGSDMTLLAAGEYKGKGSLELYSISPLSPTGLPSDCTTPAGSPQRGVLNTNPRLEHSYRNRQSAASSRLLSVASHGARIVFSDGNGFMKWVERDASTVVRSFNINDILTPEDAASRRTSASSSAATSDSEDVATENSTPRRARVERINPRRTIFADPSADANSDIVQKILPMQSSQPLSQPQIEDVDDDLLIWTGDGKLAMVGFGKDRPWQSFGHGVNESGRSRSSTLGSDGTGPNEDQDRERDRERARRYADRMREALERQADEARWVRGLGLGG